MDVVGSYPDAPFYPAIVGSVPVEESGRAGWRVHVWSWPDAPLQITVTVQVLCAAVAP